MALVDIEKTRGDVTTIYMPDFDSATIEQQIVTASEALYNAYQANGVTVSVRSPTQSKLGAIVITLTTFQDRLDKAINTVRELAKPLGVELKFIELDIGSQEVRLIVEEYVQSAYKKQISYDVESLPA